MSDKSAEWVTQVEAAALLNVHPSAIPKMLRRGDLAARGQRPSLRRADVLRLRDARAERARLRAQAPPAQQPPLESQPPDTDHDWIRAKELAAWMGMTSIAVSQRARRGRLPFTLGPDGSRRWFRREQVAMADRAQRASRTKSVEDTHR